MIAELAREALEAHQHALAIYSETMAQPHYQGPLISRMTVATHNAHGGYQESIAILRQIAQIVERVHGISLRVYGPPHSTQLEAMYRAVVAWHETDGDEQALVEALRGLA